MDPYKFFDILSKKRDKAIRNGNEAQLYLKAGRLNSQSFIEYKKTSPDIDKAINLKKKSIEIYTQFADKGHLNSMVKLIKIYTDQNFPYTVDLVKAEQYVNTAKEVTGKDITHKYKHFLSL